MSLGSRVQVMRRIDSPRDLNTLGESCSSHLSTLGLSRFRSNKNSGIFTLIGIYLNYVYEVTKVDTLCTLYGLIKMSLLIFPPSSYLFNVRSKWEEKHNQS